MARQLRIQHEGAIYHLMSRGDRREEIFRVALARDLGHQTTVSLKWIAQRLEMGSWTHVSNLISATRLE